MRAARDMGGAVPRRRDVSVAGQNRRRLHDGVERFFAGAVREARHRDGIPHSPQVPTEEVGRHRRDSHNPDAVEVVANPFLMAVWNVHKDERLTEVVTTLFCSGGIFVCVRTDEDEWFTEVVTTLFCVGGILVCVRSDEDER